MKCLEYLKFKVPIVLGLRDIFCFPYRIIFVEKINGSAWINGINVIKKQGV
jgi:hypothetical protein